MESWESAAALRAGLRHVGRKAVLWVRVEQAASRGGGAVQLLPAGRERVLLPWAHLCGLMGNLIAPGIHLTGAGQSS